MTSSQNDATRISPSRRDFLRGALAASVAAVMLTPKGVATLAKEADQPASAQAKQGYRLTPHIIAYYQSASL